MLEKMEEELNMLFLLMFSTLHPINYTRMLKIALKLTRNRMDRTNNLLEDTKWKK